MKIIGKTKEQIQNEKRKQELQQEMNELLQKLKETDYIGLLDYRMTKTEEELRKKDEQRMQWRQRIREIEKELETLK